MGVFKSFVAKSANRPGQADKAITFVKADSLEVEGKGKEEMLLKTKMVYKI